jgi:hypothetical protein
VLALEGVTALLAVREPGQHLAMEPEENHGDTD